MGFFLKSARGEWLGGLLGNIWGGWLHVTHLWVASPERRRGSGTRLLQAAERYAIERGCLAATLETHSYEARPFYEKLGYQVFRHPGRLSAGSFKVLPSEAAGV